MTREEAVNYIEDIKNGLHETGKDFPYRDEVIPVAKEALDIAIKALEQESRWIPVSERLPEEEETVIASTEYRVYPETRYTKGYGWEWAYEAGADYWESLEGVMAWMPLPESYKAESEDKE